MQYQIPKRIIQTGKNYEQPLRNRAMMNSVRLLNPDFEYLFLDDDAVSTFIDKEFPQYRGRFDSFQFHIQRFDFFRYLAIYRYGGFYLDLDVMLANDLSGLLDYGCVFPFEGLTLSQYLRNIHQMDWEIGNYAFGAAAGHPFLKAVIQNVVRSQAEPHWVEPMMQGLPRLFRQEYLVLNTTGPGLISRTLAENPDLARDVKVLFPDNVCDANSWNRFGELGVHLMDGSWRMRSSRAHRRFAQQWENWTMRKLLRQSIRLGPTRRNSPPIKSNANPSSARAKKGPESLVSILIPAYNSQEWIADALRSAINQTWKNKEIIVVDDGSTDQTLNIAKRFESDGVRVVSQSQQGAAAARNKAYSLSQGDYIQWLDADDLLAPEKIGLQMTRQEPGSKRELLSSPWGKFIYRQERAKFTPTDLWQDLSPLEWLLHKMADNVYMQTACWLVSRELTEAAGPWDTRLLGDDDGEYFCRVILKSANVRFVPEAKVYHRGPGLAFQSLSYIGLSARKVEAHWRSMSLHIDYLRSLEDSERVRKACLAFLRTSMIYFYPEREDIVQDAMRIANDLGGELGVPRLSWKYEWMKTIFGWRTAKLGQQLLLKSRWSAQKLLDKTGYHVEKTLGTKVPSSRLLRRVRGKYQRASSRYLSRQDFKIDPRTPIISFTFDDFPRSALQVGGAILRSFGFAGTFYASLGLMGGEAETGEMFVLEDLKAALKESHELGCHTFSHCHAWDTSPVAFERAIVENQRALSRLLPEAAFHTLSYPISVPKPRTKKIAANYFPCSRGGGQTFNVGHTDLNCLSAYFLEQSRDAPGAMRRTIDEACDAGGWLIFATHDVSDNPTPWGCTPDLFKEIVEYCAKSGAQVLPVFEAFQILRGRNQESI